MRRRALMRCGQGQASNNAKRKQPSAPSASELLLRSIGSGKAGYYDFAWSSDSAAMTTAGGSDDWMAFPASFAELRKHKKSLFLRLRNAIFAACLCWGIRPFRAKSGGLSCFPFKNQWHVKFSISPEVVPLTQNLALSSDRVARAGSKVASKSAPRTCCSRPRSVSTRGFGDEARAAQVQLRDIALPDDGFSIDVHRHSCADPLHVPAIRRQGAASSSMSR